MKRLSVVAHAIMQFVRPANLPPSGAHGHRPPHLASWPTARIITPRNPMPIRGLGVRWLFLLLLMLSLSPLFVLFYEARFLPAASMRARATPMLSSKLYQSSRHDYHLIVLDVLSRWKSAGRTTRPSFRLLLAQSYAQWLPRLMSSHCRSRWAK
jgi:hypothetical protein